MNDILIMIILNKIKLVKFIYILFTYIYINECKGSSKHKKENNVIVFLCVLQNQTKKGC